jgi:hypothetical protein
MRIGKTAPASICVNDSFKAIGVDSIANAWQVARLIVPPDLASRKGADLTRQDLERVAALA